MDEAKGHRIRCNMCPNNNINAGLATPSTAEKIQDIRYQLEEVIALAYNKKTKKARDLKEKRNDQLVNDDQYDSQPICIKSKNEISKTHPLQRDCIPADAKLLSYKKFISSLTRIVQDTNQYASDSDSIPTSIKAQNAILDTENTSLEDKNTALVKKDVVSAPMKAKAYQIYENHKILKTRCAEKTTYCRPVINDHEMQSKTIEKNEKLHQLVKKLVQAREREKQNEAWNNYINELKNKHGYQDFHPIKIPNLCEKEDEQSLNIIDSDKLYATSQSIKQPGITQLMFNDILYEAANNVRRESNIRRRTWCLPPSSKSYKYENNSFCCPMSSQGRLLMMQKEARGPGYTLQSRRYFRGSSILVEKESLAGKKLSKHRRSRGTNKACGSDCSIKCQNHKDLVWECRAVQTNETMFGSACDRNTERTKSNSKLERISSVTAKFEQCSSFAEKNKQKMKASQKDTQECTLFTIEHKLDLLIESFNAFLDEIKTKKVATAKCETVSCSSMGDTNTKNVYQTNSESYNVLTKHNVLYDVTQQRTLSSVSFSPCPITHGTIKEILNAEKDKSDKVKKDIDQILNNNPECAVQIMIDIPTKEGSTEVTSSFCAAQQKDSVVEEIEPVESTEYQELRKIDRSITIAVNTDPLGILALFRVSAETVKQILSYVPNLDYVTYLARRQLGTSSSMARYVCNICNASFTRPSALSDHIQAHSLANSKNCCVCRHVLDRRSHRSGLFSCTHCGQIFTRAYCRELHEQTCSKALSKNSNRNSNRPSLVMLT